LPGLLIHHGIAEVLIAIRDLPAEQIAVLDTICREHGVVVRRMRFELERVGARASRSQAGAARYGPGEAPR